MCFLFLLIVISCVPVDFVSSKILILPTAKVEGNSKYDGSDIFLNKLHSNEGNIVEEVLEVNDTHTDMHNSDRNTSEEQQFNRDSKNEHFQKDEDEDKFEFQMSSSSKRVGVVVFAEFVFCLIYVFLQTECRPPTATSTGTEDHDTNVTTNGTGKHRVVIGRFIDAPCKDGYVKVGKNCRKSLNG
ncbi:hypothetical protein FQA39_LY12157 [Lamprigera yunnana]|nr:hypothetical protein FQA39_LY12157 [Lamprigera yunnana]